MYLTSVTTIFELEKIISSGLVNSQLLLTRPESKMPTVLSLASDCVRKTRVLPNDIQAFLDDASEYGVIYVNLGSYIESDAIPIEKLHSFIEVFRSLKQRVLWHYDNKKIQNLPLNVMVTASVAENDVLAHKNITAVVTHGAAKQTQIASQYGIPMLIIPVCGDQYRHSIKCVCSGYAVVLQFADVTTSALSEKLTALLSDRRFSECAKIVSKQTREYHVAPIDDSIHRIKHIAKHKAASNHNNDECTHLDILGALFFVIVVVVKVITILLRMFHYEDDIDKEKKIK